MRTVFHRGGESWRRRQPDEDLASWSLPDFFIQRSSFIVGEIVAMVAKVGVGEKIWARPWLMYCSASMSVRESSLMANVATGQPSTIGLLPGGPTACAAVHASQHPK
jgi:hypothetical protein